MSNFKYQSRERQREKEAYRQIDTEQILWKCSSFRFSTETDHDNCSYSWDNVRHLHLRDRNAATCKYTHSQPLASTSTRIHTDELVYTTHIHSIQHTHTHIWQEWPLRNSRHWGNTEGNERQTCNWWQCLNGHWDTICEWDIHTYKHIFHCLAFLSVTEDQLTILQ